MHYLTYAFRKISHLTAKHRIHRKRFSSLATCYIKAVSKPLPRPIPMIFKQILQVRTRRPAPRKITRALIPDHQTRRTRLRINAAPPRVQITIPITPAPFPRIRHPQAIAARCTKTVPTRCAQTISTRRGALQPFSRLSAAAVAGTAARLWW